MQINWHSISLAEVFSETKGRKEGLTTVEAIKKLKDSGRNTLPQEKPYSKIRLFLRQFNSPLMYILLTTVIISFLLKHYSDTVFIIVVLLTNTIVGFYQENKANQSLLVLKKMVKIRAKVWRDGDEKEIDSEELAVGDVVFLKAGDKVPADGRIIETKNLKINEASLTGESQAVEKKIGNGLPESTPLPERINMVFMGTIVEEGRATMVVAATGINTQIGEVVSLLKEAKERKTPLQQKIATLSKVVGAFILSIIFAIAIIGYFTGKSFADIFIASLALAVSAIPAGLLPAITVILVLGMRRIFKQNGLVRKLAATETLGSITVICTDKTGTLTEGKMRVSHILTSTRELLSDHLNGLAKGENVNGVESHISALKIATLANEAFVENPEVELQEWVVRGRPTEQALLLAGMPSGLNKKELEKQYPVLDRISFESDYKFAATLHRKNEHQNMLYVIGAPEEIIARSANLDSDSRIEKFGTTEANKLIEKLETLTQKGLRVLACAHKDYDAKTKYRNLTELVKDLSLVGFIALKDPLQANGEVVAMLGDGVNDAPALKSADIGVVVGSGTDVAKEVADLVLLDDNFKTIVKSVEQGRVVFENVRKVFVYLVADDFSELFLFLASMAMGFPLPLLPAQILWINLVEDGLPDIALTTEQETKGVMDEKPRNAEEPILHRPLKLWMTAIFFITGLAAFLLFFFLWKLTGDLHKTRTIVFALMCLDSLIFAFSVRSFKRPLLRKDIFSNYFLNAAVAVGLILLVCALYLPPLQKLLLTRPLTMAEWGIVLLINTVEIAILELFKKKFFKPQV